MKLSLQNELKRLRLCWGFCHLSVCGIFRGDCLDCCSLMSLVGANSACVFSSLLVQTFRQIKARFGFHHLPSQKMILDLLSLRGLWKAALCYAESCFLGTAASCLLQVLQCKLQWHFQLARGGFSAIKNQRNALFCLLLVECLSK